MSLRMINGASRIGHRHFDARRQLVTRRTLFKASAAGAAGIALGPALLASPARGAAKSRAAGVPKPIPQFITLPFAPGKEFHVQPPIPGQEPSVITDFAGELGIAVIDGRGTAGDGTSYAYEVDIRFMDGEFVGTDGKRHKGTFGFI